MNPAKKKCRLRWTRRARTDLVSIGKFIARDNPAAALEWIGRIRKKALQAARMPFSGRVVPEMARDDVREVLLNKYRIVYRVLEKKIHILTVFEGHRLLPKGVD